MFTGHIRELGLIESFDGAQVRVRAPQTAAAVEPGGSVCVSGIRLTVQEATGGVLAATIAAETRRRSTFDSINKGVHVNLELPLAVGDALDGHLVQGYVDGVGKVARVDAEEGCLRVWIRPPERLIPQLAAKSPIAVDGVSVTIADRLRDRFSIVVVPATAAATTLDQLAPGSRVNLELDLVCRLVGSRGRAARADLPKVTAALGRAGHVSGRAGVDQALAQLAGRRRGGRLGSRRRVRGRRRVRRRAHPARRVPVPAHRGVRAPHRAVRARGPGPAGHQPHARAAATTTAPPSTSRSTWPARPAPGCRRPSGPRRCGGWPARPPCRATS